jgi:hypothetical protein
MALSPKLTEQFQNWPQCYFREAEADETMTLVQAFVFKRKLLPNLQYFTAAAKYYLETSDSTSLLPHPLSAQGR